MADVAISKGDEVRIVGTAAASTPVSPSQGGAWARFEQLLFVGDAVMGVDDVQPERIMGGVDARDGVMMDVSGRVVGGDAATGV